MRRELRMDEGWRFLEGSPEIPPLITQADAYLLTKAERGRGPADPFCYDLDWAKVDLPYDHALSHAPDEALGTAAGYLPRPSAWYRRCFVTEEGDENCRIRLRFNGVAAHAVVFVNGHLAGRNFSEYVPFTLDISEYLLYHGQTNVVAVRVTAPDKEGWFYEGAGIYRHVTLIKTGLLSFAEGGVFAQPVPPAAPGKPWGLTTELTLEDFSLPHRDFDLALTLEDPDGTTVWSAREAATALSGILPERRTICGKIQDPRLWSVDDPALYHLTAEICLAGEVTDLVTVPVGFRTLRFDAREGFFLNGEPLRFQGVCLHQDFGPLGAAVPDIVHEYRLHRMKEMGCNAIRTAHNMPAPEFLDACDRLGLLVMDETRWFERSPEAMDQLKAMVLGGRNHPSVIMYSAGNEEPLQGADRGRRILRTLREHIRAWDGSRPVMLAMNGGFLDDQAILETDLIGMNYGMVYYDAVHERYPEKPLFASETVAEGSVRGCFDPASPHGEYDEFPAPFGSTRRDIHRMVMTRPHFMGQFIWTGTDYRGECHWPYLFSTAGSVDAVGLPKGNFYLNKAQWTKEPMVRILPHWNWAGREGEAIRVDVYSNCPRVKLVRNGQCVGDALREPLEELRFDVPYEAGELLAQGLSSEGELLCQHRVCTTGAPAKLRLTPEYGQDLLLADGSSCAVLRMAVTDEDGLVVPDAEPLVHLEVLGDAVILGSFGSPADPTDPRLPDRRLSAGLGIAVLRAGHSEGPLRLALTAPGLESAELTLYAAGAPHADRVPPCDYDFPIKGWWMANTLAEEPRPLSKMRHKDDMNSWVPISIDHGPQSIFSTGQGWAGFGAYTSVPAFAEGTTAAIVFKSIRGRAHIVVAEEESGLVHEFYKEKEEEEELSLPVPFLKPGENIVLSVDIYSSDPGCGLLRPVVWLFDR